MKTVLAFACIVFAVVNAESPPTAAQRTLKQLEALDAIYEAIKLNPSDIEAYAVFNDRLSAQTQAMKRICLGNNLPKKGEEPKADVIVTQPVDRDTITQDYRDACKEMDNNWDKGMNLAGDFKQIRTAEGSAYAKYNTADNEKNYRELVKEYEDMYRAESNPASTPAKLVDEGLDVIDEMLDPIIDAPNDYAPTLRAFQIYFDTQVMAQAQAMKRICIGNNLDKPDIDVNGKVIEKSYPVEYKGKGTLTPEFKEACDKFTARWNNAGPNGKLSLKAEFNKAMNENKQAWADFSSKGEKEYRDWLNAYEAQYRQAATAA